MESGSLESEFFRKKKETLLVHRHSLSIQLFFLEWYVHHLVSAALCKVFCSRYWEPLHLFLGPSSNAHEESSGIAQSYAPAGYH